MNIRLARSSDLVRIGEIDERCFPRELQNATRDIQARFYKDKNSYVIATDSEDRAVGYIAIFGISKYQYDCLVSVTNKTYYGNRIEVINMKPDSNLLLLQSIAILPELRDGDIVMFLGEELEKRIRGKKCVCEVTSDDGAKFAERHRFLKHKTLPNGFSVYRFPNKF